MRRVGLWAYLALAVMATAWCAAWALDYARDGRSWLALLFVLFAAHNAFWCAVAVSWLKEWRATCSCGWSGEWHVDKWDAELEHSQHRLNTGHGVAA